MSGFTQQAFEKKLNDLNGSQQSIQTLSLWLIHHRKHYKAIVQTWGKELKKQSKASRRLTFIYLANDVIQNSKKKGPEFSKEFLTAMKPSLQHISKDVDAATLKSIDRVVKIWEERSIYDKASIKGLREALGASVAVKADGVKENNSNNSNASKETSSKPARKRDADDADNGRPSKKHHLDTLDTSAFLNSSKVTALDSGDLPPVDMSKYEKVDPDKLVKSLKEMENAPSRDTTVQEKLSHLPPEVFDVKLIDSALSSAETAEKVAKMVDEAASLLSSYNGRLAKELEDRKNLSTMLVYFLEAQKRAQTLTETTLGEWKEKLRKVTLVQQEFQSHLQNLPDLSQLPSVTPLPSATDLFKL